ncbi:TonB-dependent receptor [Pseudomaricurvus sp.]|uniref:TonB-dependent receptor n=1 Tax=Pseudomaricurvus sp. TaxID=2004510 RepID=UPI003F6B2785
MKTPNKTLMAVGLGGVMLSSPYAATLTHAATDNVTPNQSATIEEVVVTARRQTESLQHVPNSINVVSAESINDLKLTEFTDLESVVPGLTLSQDGSGTQTDTSMRGVSFDASSTAPPTVAMYLNDAPVQSLFLYDSLFDIGQIEVLRGPQGTTRGVSAPSGALTVTTRKPNTSTMEGYIQGLMTNNDSHNVQAGINIPLIPDKLAMRIAGVTDTNDANSVTSINNSEDPAQDTNAGRLSVLYEATPELTLQTTYTSIDKKLQSYNQVSGSGWGNQPILKPEQRYSVQDGISDVDVDLEVVTAQIDAQVFGHQLTYVGSYQEASTYALEDTDAGNILPGVAVPMVTTSGKNENTHELRLSSSSDHERSFHYTVGAFYDEAKTTADVGMPGPLMSGAFGSPAAAPDLDAFDSRYQLPITTNINYLSKETSVFANVTFDLNDRTELSAGLRHIWSEFSSNLDTELQSGLLAIPPSFINPLLPNCASAQLSSTYPGFCDLPLPSSNVLGASFEADETPTIYNLSLSYQATSDLMLYATTGTAYRPPISSPGLQGDLAANPNPELNSLTFHPKESSTNYEMGFKWTSPNQKARVNATIYYQTFEDLTTLVPNVNYLNTATGQISTNDFTASVDAEVSGFELDAAMVWGNFDLSTQVSYANGNIDDSLIPCNTDSNGVPTFNTEGLISLCPGGSSSRDPLWSASLQGQYSLALDNGIEVYTRALLSYKGDNNNLGNGLSVDSYTITNLYAGLRSQTGQWEITAFVRNLFETERTLDRNNYAYDLNNSLGVSFPQLIPPTGSGLYHSEVTAPREVGISVNYRWGNN